MRKLSLRMKLGVGFGSLLLILVTMVGFVFASLQRLSSLSAAADQKATEVVLMRVIQATINDQKAEVRGVVIGQSSEGGRFANNDRVLADVYAKLDSMITSDTGKQSFAALRDSAAAYHREQVRVMDLQRGGKTKEAAALLFSPQVNALRDQMNQSIAAFAEVADKLRQTAREEQTAGESRLSLLLVIGMLVGVAAGIAMAVYIARNLTGRVSQMMEMIQTIADNDLSREDMVIRNHDEIGTCGILLNTMKNNLREMIQSIAGTAEHVASASEEISSSATQQSQSAETQKDQTAQVATAMQEMPRSCAEAGVVQHVAPLTRIPEQILQATNYSKRTSRP